MHQTQIEQSEEGPDKGTNDSVSHRGKAMRDSMWKGHGGFEIALAPALFGGIGWLLDGYFGITPALTIVFAIVGLFGAVANQYYRFKYEFDKATEKRQAATSAEATDSATDQTPFGRVEPTPVDMSIDFGASDNVAEQVAS